MMIGYACINETLKKSEIFTSRTMRKATFDERGLNYVAELALKNCEDLFKIVKWNESNNLRFFRMSSNLFPWQSEYELEDLHTFPQFSKILKEVGEFASSHNHRLTFHPDHFVKLSSNSEKIVKKSILDLENHAKIMDLMGLSRTPYNKINIHVGGAYGDKVLSAQRFCENFQLLSDSVKSRLTVENDDKVSLFTTFDLRTLIYENIKTPIVFDYHHHSLNDGNVPMFECLEICSKTWNSVKPVVHYSESRSKEYNDPTIKPQAHSDYVYQEIPMFDLDLDVMIEAKSKELATLKYLKMFGV